MSWRSKINFSHNNSVVTTHISEIQTRISNASNDRLLLMVRFPILFRSKKIVYGISTQPIFITFDDEKYHVKYVYHQCRQLISQNECTRHDKCFHLTSLHKQSNIMACQQIFLSNTQKWTPKCSYVKRKITAYGQYIMH